MTSPERLFVAAVALAESSSATQPGESATSVSATTASGSFVSMGLQTGAEAHVGFGHVTLESTEPRLTSYMKREIVAHSREHFEEACLGVDFAVVEDEEWEPNSYVRILIEVASAISPSVLVEKEDLIREAVHNRFPAWSETLVVRCRFAR